MPLKSCYRSLKNIGTDRILNTIESPDQDLAQSKHMARLSYANIRVLTAEVHDVVEKICKEQFQNPSFLKEVQDEVLKCVEQKLSSAAEMEIKEAAGKEGEDFVKTPHDYSMNSCASGMTAIKLGEEEDRQTFDKASKDSACTAQKSLPTHVGKHEDVSPFIVKQKEVGNMPMNKRNSAKVRSVPRKVGRKKGKD